MAMTLIETITVGSGGAASIEFTGIPQDGKDLKLLFSTRQDGFAHNQIMIQFNSDTNNNYSVLELTGSGTNVISASGTRNSARIKAASPGPSETANTFGSSSVLISNYATSGAKPLSSESVTENNSSQAFQSLGANSWAGPAVITTITCTGDGADFVEHSTASLYSIS